MTSTVPTLTVEVRLRPSTYFNRLAANLFLTDGGHEGCVAVAPQERDTVLDRNLVYIVCGLGDDQERTSSRRLQNTRFLWLRIHRSNYLFGAL